MLRLKEIRNQLNMQQKDVCKSLEIPQNTYSQYENGKRQPDNETLIKLAEFFNVSTDYLLGRTDNRHQKPGDTSDLTTKETDLIEKYRSLDLRGKSNIDAVIAMEYNNSQNATLKIVHDVAARSNDNNKAIETVETEVSLSDDKKFEDYFKPETDDNIIPLDE